MLKTPATLLMTLLAAGLVGCSMIGEIAYDNKLSRETEACKRLPDQTAYRSCMDRVRASEAEAAKARK